MAKKKGGISQVHEFMVVGPDVHGESSELGENPALTMRGGTDKPGLSAEFKDDAFIGPRQWVAKWFGPFFNVTGLPVHSTMGLYMLYVGNYPLFVSSSATIISALSRHLIFSGHQAIPIDLLGREILHYSGIYGQQLTLKTALLFEDDRLIHPREHIACYRRAAAALAFSHSMPCNKYARVSYEFDSLMLKNLGRSFPLKESFIVERPDK